MGKTIFKSDAGRRELEAGYERLRAHIPDAHGRYVRTRFGDTHVLVAGPEEAPPLFLLHGASSCSAHMMRPFIPLLDRFRVYVPDMIGQTVKSADARLPYDGPACGEWLVDVMDGLGVEKAHVYGASLGGFMARKLAEHMPERIDRLVLMVPAGIVTNSPFAILSEFLVPMLAYRVFPSRDRLRRFLGAMMTTLDAESVDQFGDAFRGFRHDMRMPPLASPESLVRFTRPTLVVGASDDLFFPGVELLARAKVLFPQAETELLVGCRHVPPIDTFTGPHAARVARFLAARDASSAIAA